MHAGPKDHQPEVHPLLELENWLEHRFVGYDAKLLRMILAMVFSERAVLLIGRHGIGKTRLVASVAAALDERFAHYDASKAELPFVCGFPNLAAKSGRFEFLEHDQAIWSVELVHVDELSRANEESQNLWLQVVEERKIFGRPLKLRSLIASCNPSIEGYSATFDLDQALRDRFAAVIPLPNFSRPSQDVTALIAQVALRDLGAPPRVPTAAIRERLHGIRQELLAEPALVKLLSRWIAFVVHHIEKDSPAETYISPRTISSFALAVVDLWAYETVALGPRSTADRCAAAELAARYALCHKAEISDRIFEDALRAARHFLVRALRDSHDQLDLIGTGSLAQRVRAAGKLKPPSTPEQRQRAELLLRMLVMEVVQARDAHTRRRLAALWTSLSAFPSLRRDIEQAALSLTINDLLQPRRIHRRWSASRTLVMRKVREKAREDPQFWRPAHVEPMLRLLQV